jgi:predicted alpha/beta-fold hydrolase
MFNKIEAALKCIKTHHFDEIVTTKLLKYDSVEDLYKRIKCVEEVKHIVTPTLFISSADDPVIK